MTEWEKQRERTEFAKAADVYQPLSTSLESKFTRGESAHNIEEEKEQVRATITLYPIGRPVRATITLYPIGRSVRATITLYPIGRPVRATIYTVSYREIC